MCLSLSLLPISSIISLVSLASLVSLVSLLLLSILSLSLFLYLTLSLSLSFSISLSLSLSLSSLSLSLTLSHSHSLSLCFSEVVEGLFHRAQAGATEAAATSVKKRPAGRSGDSIAKKRRSIVLALANCAIALPGSIRSRE